MKQPCEIIRDLLPLYQDGVCSAESVQAVEEHLPECPPCSEALEAMRVEVRVAQPATPEDVNAGGAILALVRRWKRSWIFISVASVVAAIILTLVSYWAYRELFEYDVVPIPASQVEVAYMYRDPHGTLWIRLRIKDGKAPRSSSWQSIFYDVLSVEGKAPDDSKWVEQGGEKANPRDEYMLALRPRVVLGYNPNALSGEVGKEIGYRDEGRLLYGTLEDYIVLWEPGMDVPVLTEEEARQRFQDAM